MTKQPLKVAKTPRQNVKKIKGVVAVFCRGLIGIPRQDRDKTGVQAHRPDCNYFNTLDRTKSADRDNRDKTETIKKTPRTRPRQVGHTPYRGVPCLDVLSRSVRGGNIEW